MIHSANSFVLEASQHKIINGIVPYVLEHEPAVKKIALEHMPRLVDTWTFTQEEYQKLYLSDVKPALEDTHCNPTVYICQGKPAGFITYSFSSPWYSKLFKHGILNAKIHHLAVDTTYKGQGYGSALLNHVLEDCKKKSVAKVSLVTTDPGLGSYYTRFGFDLVRQNKMAQAEYALRLKPHPAIFIAQSMLKFCKKKI